MSLHFHVVYEAPADFATSTELADRVLVDSVEWLDVELLAGQRTWHDKTSDGKPLTWTGIKRLARGLNLATKGHFAGEPGADDSFAARRAIAALKATAEDFDGVMLIRDQDDRPDRRKGLEQARAEHGCAPPVVIGIAVVERESWVISGFVPQNRLEQERLDDERKALGFNPCESSQYLNACKDDNAKRSPKRMLRVLCGGDEDRERRCWTNTSLDELSRRGLGNGLASFLDEVTRLLVPLVDPTRPRS